MRGLYKGLLVAGFAIGLDACSFERIAANGTVNVMDRASPALQSFADPAIAEASLPYSITQMEGLLLVVPQNRLLRTNLMRALGSYGFAFLEDRMEEAEVANDDARVEYYRNRASIAYSRGKEVGFETLSLVEGADGGATGAVHRGVDAWRAYLQRFDDRQQTGLLFWLGYNWARHINLNKDNPDVLADLPFAIAVFERVMQLDPDFNYSAPRIAMASYYARAAASLGGEPERSRQLFEEAIHRFPNFLTYKVMMARVYAVMVQDRALFTRLLQEVIDAGDVMPEQRLANQIAKRRARRYLAQVEDLVAPPDDSSATPASEGAAPPADAPAPATETPAPAAAPAATPAPAAPTAH